MKHPNFIPLILICFVSLTMFAIACKTGSNVADSDVEISGQITDRENATPLKEAIITNNTTKKSVLSDSLGRFRIVCEKGDSINISYVGLLSQTIPVNPKDSVEWNISMCEYGPIIEPALQKSYSTNDKLKMVIVNPDALEMPVDSIVVEMINSADEEAIFGEWYNIEKKINGQWVNVTYNEKVNKQIDNGIAIVFSAIAYILPPHQSQLYVNPTKVYNQMIIPGEYRLSKTFSYPPYPTEKSDTVYVEFEIQ